MDLSLILSAVTAKSASLQGSIATQVIANNNRAEKEAVQTLLGAGGGSSQANVASGVGGQVDISA
jgi:hypothetical protein